MSEKIKIILIERQRRWKRDLVAKRKIDTERGKITQRQKQ